MIYSQYCWPWARISRLVLWRRKDDVAHLKWVSVLYFFSLPLRRILFDGDELLRLHRRWVLGDALWLPVCLFWTPCQGQPTPGCKNLGSDARRLSRRWEGCKDKMESHGILATHQTSKRRCLTTAWDFLIEKGTIKSTGFKCQHVLPRKTKGGLNFCVSSIFRLQFANLQTQQIWRPPCRPIGRAMGEWGMHTKSCPQLHSNILKANSYSLLGQQ